MSTELNESFNLERLLKDYDSGKIKSFNAFSHLNQIHNENEAPHIDLRGTRSDGSRFDYKLFGENGQNPDPNGIFNNKNEFDQNSFGFGGSAAFGGSGSGGGY